jgi:hypothetical protein
MAWVKLDDGFADHPKVAQAGPLAGWLYVKALVYCGRYLTDGFIPRAVALGLVDWDTWGVQTDKPVLNAKLARALVELGLWEEEAGGYRVHDYLDCNPSADEVRARREQLLAKRREAGAKGGRAKAANASSKPSKPLATDVANAKQPPSNRPSKNVAPYPIPIPERDLTPSPFGGSPLPGLPAPSPAVSTPPPSAPANATVFESELKLESPAPATKAKRACALPPAFEPTAKHHELASELALDVTAECVKFRDYHLAHGRVMKDWDAAFRTWLRNAVTYSQPRLIAGRRASVIQPRAPDDAPWRQSAEVEEFKFREARR